jgi:hypothetical protein
MVLVLKMPGIEAIVLTGRGSAEDRRACLELGAFRTARSPPSAAPCGASCPSPRDSFGGSAGLGVIDENRLPHAGVGPHNLAGV